MKLCLDPSVIAPRNITAESFVLAWWYDSQPTIRRLWGIKNARKLRVVVAVEPTHDNDDIYPAWLANVEAWTSELQMQIESCVQLELVRESPFEGIEIEADSVVIADLFWRDATLNQPYCVL